MNETILILLIVPWIFVIIIICLMIYDRVQYKSWVWERLYIRLFGQRYQAFIIDSLEKPLKYSGKYFQYSIYIVVVEFILPEEPLKRKAIITDAAMSGRYSKYCIGKKINIFYSKLLKGKAIVDKKEIHESNSKKSIKEYENKMLNSVKEDF